MVQPLHAEWAWPWSLVPEHLSSCSHQPRGGTYSGIHASGFRDFLLKPELLRAVVDCGFEHPSEVQHECIPQAILGMDVLCQAKSGMGKTAVFVLSSLHQVGRIWSCDEFFGWREGLMDGLMICVMHPICSWIDGGMDG